MLKKKINYQKLFSLKRIASFLKRSIAQILEKYIKIKLLFFIRSFEKEGANTEYRKNAFLRPHGRLKNIQVGD